MYGASQSTSNASAGDCVQNTGSASSPNVSVVDCTSSDAEYKIIGKISGSANADDCAAQSDLVGGTMPHRGDVEPLQPLP